MVSRIQRRRIKGWKMPDGVVYVGRGSVWGNPFVVGNPSGVFDGKEGRSLGLHNQCENLVPAVTLKGSINFYREMMMGFLAPEMYPWGHEWMREFKQKKGAWLPSEAARSLLRGKALACWCATDTPCHADVLLEIANR